MTVDTAHNIIKQLPLSKGQLKELSVLINGGEPKKRVKQKVLIVRHAENLFIKLMKSKNKIG